MLSRKQAEDLGFRIDFSDPEKFRLSYDGGQSWRCFHLYNMPETILKHQLGQFHVKCVVKPELKADEELCHICANLGQVGIVRYAGIVEGTEKVCVEKWDGDYNWTQDIDVWCRYAQWKCQRCGYVANSEYA